MIRETRSCVRPNMQAQYVALVKSDLFPALKKLEAKTHRTRQVQWGGSRVWNSPHLGHGQVVEAGRHGQSPGRRDGQGSLRQVPGEDSAIIVFSEYTIYTLNAEASFRK